MTPSRRRTVKKVGDLIGSFVGREGEDAHRKAKEIGDGEHLAHYGFPLLKLICLSFFLVPLLLYVAIQYRIPNRMKKSIGCSGTLMLPHVGTQAAGRQ